jgi:hypothetical protein
MRIVCPIAFIVFLAATTLCRTGEGAPPPRKVPLSDSPVKAVLQQASDLTLGEHERQPRRLWFEAPNKSEYMWDVNSIDDKVKLKREDFDAPSIPPGWKLIEVGGSK